MNFLDELSVLRYTIDMVKLPLSGSKIHLDNVHRWHVRANVSIWLRMIATADRMFFRAAIVPVGANTLAQSRYAKGIRGFLSAHTSIAK